MRDILKGKIERERERVNKSSTFLSGYCTPQEGYIEPFIPAASCAGYSGRCWIKLAGFLVLAVLKRRF